MSTLMRIQFAKYPRPEVIAAIIANAVMDPSYEDTDFLEDQD